MNPNVNKYRMTSTIVELGLLADQPFVLIDVGASGGIDERWRVFGDNLFAFGFEPLIEECERLNQTRHSSKIRYFPYFISDENKRPSSMDVLSMREKENMTPFGRSSAIRGEAIVGQTSIERSNSGNPASFADQILTLDQFVERNTDAVCDVDFIKIDTDGSDFEVLRGAEKTLSMFNVLGIALEASFHPPPVSIRTAQLFSTIDEFCRSCGFRLYEIIPYRYSRRDLPSVFRYHVAQTVSGQVVWADCVYFKDLCGSDEMASKTIHDSKLLKLACLYEIYNFPDCAAELIIRYQEKFDEITNRKTELLLNALTPSLNGIQYTYRQYNDEFNKNIQLFFNGGVEIDTLSAEVVSLRGRLNAVLNSKSWKLTRPIRWLQRYWNNDVPNKLGKRALNGR